MFSLITIPYFRNLKFVKVCSLVGRYFYNLYKIKKFEIVFSFNVRDNNIFPLLHNIRLSYNIYTASLFYQSRMPMYT